MPRKSLHSSINNLSYKSLLIIFFFLLISIVVLWKFVLPNHKVEASWWNDGWNYRKAVSISNTSGSNLTDFQVSLSIGTSALIASGKMQSDCDDIRITDINGNLLPFWIHPDFPCNTDTTKIFVKVPSIPTSDATIFLYYGNTSASSNQNPLEVFDLWDDFTDANLNSNKWNTTGTSATGSVTVINGYASLNNTSNANTILISKDSFNENDYIIESRLKVNTYSTDLDGQFGWSAGARSGIGTYDDTVNGNEKPHRIYVPSIVQGTEVMTTTWKPFTFQAKSGDIKSTFGTETLTSSATHSYSSGPVYFYTNTVLSTHIDFIALRKYASVEPTLDFQSEEVGGGPIAYWKFDEGTGTAAYDSTDNQNNGTISNASWQTEDQCITNKCLQFDGVDDTVTVNNLNYPATWNDPFTISAWVFVPSSATWTNSYYGTIIAKGGYNGSYGLIRHPTNNQVTMWIRGDDGAVSANGLITRDKWYYLTGTWDGTTVRLYINGVLKQESGSERTGVPDSGSLNIGQAGSYSGAGGNWFNGKIDEPKFYAYARTADQIKKDYNSRGGSSQGTSANLGTAGSDNNLSEGLVGYWKMDEGVGTSITDSSGNSNTGILTNVGWTNGKFGIGTSYNGTNNVILVSDTNNTLDMPNDFTISFWAKPDSSGVKELVAKAQGGNYEIWQNSTSLSVRVNGSSPVITASNIFTYGEWTHVTVKYERTLGLVTIYKDGQYSYKGTNTNSASINNNALQIGAYSDGTSYPFAGKIDELRIYNRALSPSEITQLYEYTPGPIAYWDLNEASGTTVYDKSGNNLNGTFGIGSSAPSWSSGKYGGGVDFSPTTKFINIPVNSSFKTNTSGSSFSYSLWFKSNNVSAASQYLITNNEPCNNPGSFSIRLSSGILSFVYYSLNLPGAVTHSFTPSITLQNNTWYHLEWTKTFGELGVKAYLNGIPQTVSGDSTATGNTTARILLGAYNGTGSTCTGGVTDSPPVANMSLNGSIDDVKIYNYIRTQKQIIEDMNAGAPAASTKSVLAYYKFDEGSGTTVYNYGIGGTALNGTLAIGDSAPNWFNEGKNGKALSFDGVNDYAQTATFPSSDSFSISIWFKPGDSITTNQRLYWGNGSDRAILAYSGTSGNLQWYIATSNGNTTYKVSTNRFKLNDWNQATLIYNGNTVKLYINGVQDPVTASITGTSNSSGFNLGTSYNHSNYFFNGYLDEFKFYNYALTDEEVKQDYNQSSALQMGQTSQTIGGTTTSLEYCIPGDTSYCASPVAEWKMDEGSGTSVNDTSGNNYTVSLENSPSWTQGKIGKSIQLNGSSQRGNVGTAINPSLITAETWLYRTSSATNQGIIRKQNAYAIALYNDTIQVAPGSNWSWYDTTQTIPLNTWIHLAWTYDGSYMKLYKNGSLVWTSASLSGTFPSNSYTTWIGYDDNNWWWGGKIDQFRIYNYARTPAQIAYDYNKGGPVGWWKFDECQGNIAYDWSGIGNTGTIIIGASGTQNSLGTCAVGTSAAWTNGATGKLNSSLNFDGTDDYITIPNLLTDYPVSVSMWIKPNTITDADIAFYLYLTSGKYITGGFYTSYGFITNASNVHADASLFPIGQWKHVVVTMTSSTTGKIYVDGIDRTTSSAQRYVESGTISNIAARNNTNLFQGQIDDVKVYNYALTDTQVKTLYNNGAVSFN